MHILGCNFQMMPNDKISSVPESAIKIQSLQEQMTHKHSFKSARFSNQSSNLGAVLKAAPHEFWAACVW